MALQQPCPALQKSVASGSQLSSNMRTPAPLSYDLNPCQFVPPQVTGLHNRGSGPWRPISQLLSRHSNLRKSSFLEPSLPGAACRRRRISVEARVPSATKEASKKRAQLPESHEEISVSKLAGSQRRGRPPNTEAKPVSPDRQRFNDACKTGNVVPMFRRIYGDQLTPVLAYRCLVKEDDREAPSVLFESVEDGTRAGRYSILAAQPAIEVMAFEEMVTILDHRTSLREDVRRENPLDVPVEISKGWRVAAVEGLPKAFVGGWVGYTSYDTVRYVERKKLPFSSAPEDDRFLPDLHLSLYNDVLVFDQVSKIVYAIHWVHLNDHDSIDEAYELGQHCVDDLVQRVQATPKLPSGLVDLNLSQQGEKAASSNMTEEQFKQAVRDAKEHILAGDIFQIVLSQRFERRTFADPFEIYRALRIVNPSPYMFYLQARGSILVASSPEILCRIKNNKVVNRPLAGTRPRGSTDEEDRSLQAGLLEDEKEKAEHVMLVDLGRNDVGKVSKAGSVRVERFMDVERYSHVMHISSTVTGQLLDHLTCWDALKAALPVGTVSGAPKVRAMELIDELEPTRRGPYSGGIGMVSYTGDMDIALALRTMVIPTGGIDFLYKYHKYKARREWVVHLQAGAGIVADSDPQAEYQETVNKAAALGRAIDLAEEAFLAEPRDAPAPSPAW